MLQAAGLYGQFGQVKGNWAAIRAIGATQVPAAMSSLARHRATQSAACQHRQLCRMLSGAGGDADRIEFGQSQIRPELVQQTYQNQLNAAWNAYLLQLGVPSTICCQAPCRDRRGSGGTSQTQSPGPSRSVSCRVGLLASAL